LSSHLLAATWSDSDSLDTSYLYNIKHHIAINIKISMSYMITNTNNILPRKMLMILRIDKENTSIILLQYLYSS